MQKVPTKLQAELKKLNCQVIDAEEARTTTHREALLILAQNFDYQGALLLCEPSIVGGRSGAPDIVILDPRSGVHVVEVKGVTLDQVRAVHMGGAIEIIYDTNTARKDPSRQARNKMFDIKNAASRYFAGDLHVPFQSWVIFPRISQSEWENKFGEAVAMRPDVIFTDDLESSHLRPLLQREGIDRLNRYQLSQCPEQQMRSVMAAFGDDLVLEVPPRTGAKPAEGTKGDRLCEELAENRILTDMQKQLTAQVWDDGPRLVRGVAGSGKTVVMATQVARMIERLQRREADMFAPRSFSRPCLAVCFNRTLVPFIQQRIELAYQQRTGEDVPKNSLLVTHFNTLLYRLHSQGYCDYYRVKDFPDAQQRSKKYLDDLATVGGEHGTRLSQGLFHAIYVDEGQDFLDDDYRLLLKLSARGRSDEQRLLVFYDDAQNLYGRQRPTWTDLGLELRGRSVVMDKCYRNTRQIIEPAFNLLLGTHADNPSAVKTRGFADIQRLQEKNLIRFDKQHVRVSFSDREGDPPRLHTNASDSAEDKHLAKHCEDLLSKEGLLPQDIMILTFRRERARQLAAALAEQIGEEKVHCSFLQKQKDELAVQPNKVTVSTAASAKGYDAPYVIVASVDEFPDDIEGRASLYVACTRARDWLELSVVESRPLVKEIERSLGASNTKIAS